MGPAGILPAVKAGRPTTQNRRRNRAGPHPRVIPLAAGLDAAALGFGALPLAPQGLAPLTPFRCGERGLPLWKVRTCTYRPYNVTFSQYILLKAFRFRLGYRNGMGLRKAIGYGSLRSPNAGGRMLCQSKRI